MTIESEVAALAAATTALTAAVNVAKASLDTAVTTATTEADAAVAAAATVSEMSSAINAVAADLTHIDTVATNITNVNTVAGANANIAAVAADLTALNAVAADLTNINAVQADLSMINTVAMDTANINTVASIFGNVNTVAGVSANVTTVAGISANVTSVAGVAANVTAVAGDLTAINSVAADLTALNSVAADLTNINAASGYASTATTQAAASAASAAAALVSANNAASVVTGGTASLLPAPGKIPLANSAGKIDAGWTTLNVNDIGVPGNAGFGVGICPAVPAGYTPMAGCTDVSSANYGNYTYSDGSICVWVPGFYLRIGNAANPTYSAYGVNSTSIKPLSAFPDDATANAEGYYRHRAFINAGANQLGFWRDKYDASQNGTIASSIYNAMPLVSGPAAGQVGFSVCTANGQTPANAYYGAFATAKSRGAKFFPESVFIADALCQISEAHAQASTSTTYCAYYSSGTTNFPKGNDNNALHSGDDSGVVFTTAGASSYANFALAGSGVPFAKTTHNGQACGISDVAGNIYKINPGLTCIATTKTITGATQANPVALTIVAHGRTTGDPVQIESVGGMTQINGKIFSCTVVDADHITLDATNGTAFGAYTSGGTCIGGTFYTLKTSADIAAVTGGNSGATDHWGATGVAALFDAVTLKFNTTYPNNDFAQRYGNGANAVFDMSTSNGRILTMMGMPASGGVSPSGSNAMGLDYYYQYIRDQLCVQSRGLWNNGSSAGGRNRYLNNSRTYATYYVGLACASYL